MYKKIFLLLVLIGLFPLVSAMESGLNYYDSFQDRPTITSPNKSLQRLGMSDDLSVGANNGIIADIDNDGVNEYLYPAYDGYLFVMNHTSLMTNSWEGRSKDFGTILYAGAMMNYQYEEAGPVDNDGDGYLDWIVADYGSTVDIEVWEWTGSDWEYTSVGQILGGYSRTTPTWCDVDSDGDMDIFHCEYSGGECELHTYDGGGVYSYNATFNFVGKTFHYDSGSTCGDIDNDGNEDDLIVTSYTGNWYLLEGSTSGLTLQYSSGDVGTFWNKGAIGDFSGNGENYLMVCEDSFPCWIYNLTNDMTSPTLLATSTPDPGSLNYGHGYLRAWNMDGKDYVVTSNSYGAVQIMELTLPSTLTVTEIGFQAAPSNVGSMTIFNDSEDTYIISPTSSASDSLPILLHKTGAETWERKQVLGNFENELFSREFQVYSGGYIMAGFMCGNLDQSNPEFECVFTPYSGFTHYFGLYNTTEYRGESYASPQVSVLDIMPLDALRWRNPDDGLVYCINEDRNMLLHSTGEGQIDSWANIYDDDGDAIANEGRVFDGILSTHDTRFDSQNSVDYTYFDSGTDQWFEWNASSSVHLGQLKFWSYFADFRLPKELRIQISDTNCDNPNFVTVYNYSEDNYMMAHTSEGLTVRFIPQDVQCIRVTASGSTYSSATTRTSVTTNYITELEGYYANNCTFYTVPLDTLGASIGNNYNISNTIYELKKEESVNTHYSRDYQGAMRAATSFNINVVDKIIEWLVRY
jgi:hypothetical protein